MAGPVAASSRLFRGGLEVIKSQKEKTSIETISHKPVMTAAMDIILPNVKFRFHLTPEFIKLQA
jgi:hypothetical protein